MKSHNFPWVRYFLQQGYSLKFSITSPTVQPTGDQVFKCMGLRRKFLIQSAWVGRWGKPCWWSIISSEHCVPPFNPTLTLHVSVTIISVELHTDGFLLVFYLLPSSHRFSKVITVVHFNLDSWMNLGWESPWPQGILARMCCLCFVFV